MLWYVSVSAFCSKCTNTADIKHTITYKELNFNKLNSPIDGFYSFQFIRKLLDYETLNFPVLLYNMVLFGTKGIQHKVSKFGILNYLEKIKLIFKIFKKEKSKDSVISFSWLRAYHFRGQDWKWYFFIFFLKSFWSCVKKNTPSAFLLYFHTHQMCGFST